MNFVKYLTLLILVVFSSQFCLAQASDIVVSQDAKFEKLLNEKRKISANNFSDDTFKIQIFSGVTDEAKQTLLSFRKEFAGVESTIVFSTPNYRVIAGNFKTRIEAERNLILIKKVYKNALLIRPRR